MELGVEGVETDDGWEFVVTTHGAAARTHHVTVSKKYMQKLGWTNAEELVRKSFAFLLEREPNTSILQTFDLPVIKEYFPEYEKTMKK